MLKFSFLVLFSYLVDIVMKEAAANQCFLLHLSIILVLVIQNK